MIALLLLLKGKLIHQTAVIKTLRPEMKTNLWGKVGRGDHGALKCKNAFQLYQIVLKWKLCFRMSLMQTY